jgi:hypothetical protein
VELKGGVKRRFGLIDANKGVEVGCTLLYRSALMKVFVIESSYPDDFYAERIDGVLTSELLKLLRASPRLRFSLDLKHFQKAVEEAARDKFDVLHISCHGDDDGIALTDNTQLSWQRFVQCFQTLPQCPAALVMSACCGAAAGIGEAFSQVMIRPNIIFGSTDERYFSEYAVAWALLYKEFKSGVTRDAAQAALRKISAVVHEEFRYRRWDDERQKYLLFPGSGKTYEIVERSQDSQE